MALKKQYAMPITALGLICVFSIIGGVGDLFAYLSAAGLVMYASLINFKEFIHRTLGIATACFTAAHVTRYMELSVSEGILVADIADSIGYIVVIVAILGIVRNRVRKVEISTLFEVGSIACAFVMLILFTKSISTNTSNEIAFAVFNLAGTMIISFSFLGRSKNKFNLALVVSMFGVATVESLISYVPPERFNAVWALPYLGLIFAFWLPQKEKILEAASISARRRFGTTQQFAFAILLILPLLIVSSSALFASDENITPLIILGILSVAFLMLRFRLLIRQRDWSYKQEQKLKRYGEKIISSNKPKKLNTHTLNTLESLTDKNTKVAILESINGGNHILLENSVTPTFKKTRLKPLSLGSKSQADDWFDKEQPGGSQICVRVPKVEDSVSTMDRYFVASTPKIVEADLEEHFKSAAAQYALAIRSNELSAQIQEERATNRFNALTQDSNDLILIVNSKTFEIEFVGPNADKLLGHTSESLLKDTVLTHIHPQDIILAKEHLFSSIHLKGIQVTDVRMNLPNQNTRWFEMSVRDLTNEKDIDGLLVSLSDVNDRKLAGFNLRNSEARFRALVQNSSDVSMLADSDFSVLYVSPNIEAMFNIATEDLVGSSLLGFISEESHENLHHLFMQAKENGSAVQAETFVRTSLGADSRLSEISVAPSHLDGSETYVVTIKDITSRRQLEDDLRSKAIYDDLTGLLNRSSFVHETQICLQDLDPKSVASVVCLNIRDFKELNDSAGFTIGDKVLSTVASRLRSELKKGDQLARLSADEFAVTCIRNNIEETQELAESLSNVFNEPFSIENRTYTLSASNGFSWTRDRRKNPEVLIQQATVAMHHARSTGSTTPDVFIKSMQQETAERFELAGELRGALTDGDFSLVYQPLISLEDNRVLNFEALIRWNHPERGNISPAVFIPLAEANGLIVEIGRWVLQQALNQLSIWKNTFKEFEDIGVSVNLSARQLENEKELNGLIDIIRKSNTKPTDLILELTESTMVTDAGRIHTELNTLRDLGIKIAIDDFGTGVSGLSHLRELPFDSVKIDKAFIDKIGVSQEGTLLVQQIIELSKAMGAYIVAEGIEEPEQVDILTAMGCDVGQGFYLARPMNPEKIVNWIKERSIGNLVSS